VDIPQAAGPLMLDRTRLDDRRRARRRRWQARYRARVAAGVMTVNIAIDHRVVDWLVATRWLPGREVYTRAEIADALARMIADATQN
jgi:hypothetical protein